MDLLKPVIIFYRNNLFTFIVKNISFKRKVGIVQR